MADAPPPLPLRVLGAPTTGPAAPPGVAAEPALATPADLTFAVADAVIRRSPGLSVAQALAVALDLTLEAVVGPPGSATAARRPAPDGLSWGPDSVALYEDGGRAGEAWARRAAPPEELGRLTAFYRGPGGECLLAFARDHDAPGRGGAEAFHAVVRPAEDGRPGAAEAFWRAALDSADSGKQASGHFALGFAERALPDWMLAEDDEA